MTRARDFLDAAMRADAKLIEAKLRITQLEESEARAMEMLGTLGIKLAEIKDLLPPCPTCGGTHRLNVGEGHPAYGRCKVWTEDGYICPDCIDGKVSIEQAMAIVRAVFDDSHQHVPHDCCLTRVRAVKPEPTNLNNNNEGNP